MKLSILLAFLSGSNILVTLLFQWYIIYQLGVGVETDAFYAGMTIPQVVLSIVSGSLANVLIPLLSVEDSDSFTRKSWSYFIRITGLFLVIAILLSLSSPYWVPVIFKGFTEYGKILALRLTRIQLIGMVFTAAASVLWAINNARKKFVSVETIRLIANIISLLILLWLLPLYGVLVAAWAMVIRFFIQVIWFVPGIGRFRWSVSRKSEFQEAWKRLKPLLLGSLYYKSGLIIDRFLSSLAVSGSLSLLSLAHQIYGAGAQIINKAITSTIMPRLAKSAHKKDWTQFIRQYKKRLFATGLITITIYVGCLTVGNYILQLLIGYGGVTKENVKMLWIIMICLGGVFIGGANGQITSAGFYAIGNTRTPTIIGMITYTIFIPIKVIAFIRYEIVGLAISTSIFFISNFLLQIFYFRKVLRNE